MENAPVSSLAAAPGGTGMLFGTFFFGGGEGGWSRNAFPGTLFGMLFRVEEWLPLQHKPTQKAFRKVFRKSVPKSIPPVLKPHSRPWPPPHPVALAL